MATGQDCQGDFLQVMSGQMLNGCSGGSGYGSVGQTSDTVLQLAGSGSVSGQMSSGVSGVVRENDAGMTVDSVAVGS